jgi:hypothetical protein
MFASRSVAIHLLRGAIGVAAIWSAIRFGAEHPWALVVCVAVMLLAFGGCPTCWIMGLCEINSRKATPPS